MTAATGATAVSPTINGYLDSRSHLQDELARIDQLVRAQTIRWRLTVAANKPDSLWGMLTVSDQEVDAYLTAPFRGAGSLPPELDAPTRPYLQSAESAATTIDAAIQATSGDTDLRLRRLCAQFCLNDHERDILLVCLLPDLEPRYRRLFGYLGDDVSRTRPTVELVADILKPVHGPIRAALSERAPLRLHGLVVSASTNATNEPYGLAPLWVDPRVVNHLLEVDTLDDRLGDAAKVAEPALNPSDLIVSTTVATRISAVAAVWRERRVTGEGLAVLIHGPYGSGRSAAAEAICGETGTPLVTIDAEMTEHLGRGWEEVFRAAYREASLRRAAVLWTSCDRLMRTDALAPIWRRLMEVTEGFPGLTLFSTNHSWDPAGRFHRAPFLSLELPPPDFCLRRRIWEKHLPDAPADANGDDGGRRSAMIDVLAEGFQLTEGQIVDALATARAIALGRAPESPIPTVGDLTDGCRRQSSRGLVSFARRVEPRPGMSIDDLILPDISKRQLHDLHNRIRFRNRMRSEYGLDWRMTLGKGTVALFAGSSGTGKTLAATLLASLHGVDLYKVDLAAVVSKYVGETEKNLERLFKDAEDTNAIIFFDEADALFGKRGEIKEARDRWANIETNFLLQRIEDYPGVVILATNLRQNVDQAFLRRIHVLVEFPFPDKILRERIWLSLFPDGVKRPPANQIRELAERFDLAGGSIKNIVLDATFRALADAPESARKPTVTMKHIVASLARDQDKAGKPVTRSEFGEKFYGWIAEDGG